MTMKFDELYKDLMGNEYDKNDPIMICMTNLKDQLNLNNKPIASTLNNSLSEEEDDLDDFEEDDEDEDELDEEDELDDGEYSNDFAAYAGKASQPALSYNSAALVKKPLAKALSNNRRISKLNPSVLSPPTTDASNSSMSAYEPASSAQTSKAKRFKKN